MFSLVNFSPFYLDFKIEIAKNYYHQKAQNPNHLEICIYSHSAVAEKVLLCPRMQWYSWWGCWFMLCFLNFEALNLYGDRTNIAYGQTVLQIQNDSSLEMSPLRCHEVIVGWGGWLCDIKVATKFDSSVNIIASFTLIKSLHTKFQLAKRITCFMTIEFCKCNFVRILKK